MNKSITFSPSLKAVYESELISNMSLILLLRRTSGWFYSSPMDWFFVISVWKLSVRWSSQMVLNEVTEKVYIITWIRLSLSTHQDVFCVCFDRKTWTSMYQTKLSSHVTNPEGINLSSTRFSHHMSRTVGNMRMRTVTVTQLAWINVRGFLRQPGSWRMCSRQPLSLGSTVR